MACLGALSICENRKINAGFLAHHLRSLQCLLIPYPQDQDCVQDSSTHLFPTEYPPETTTNTGFRSGWLWKYADGSWVGLHGQWWSEK